MQNVYVRIDEITDDIYINHIWLARSLSDDNLEESIKHLNKAINLSVENIEVFFTDIGDPWLTAKKPNHDNE